MPIWLAHLPRERVETGDLADLVEKQQVVGVTTNQTIFATELACDAWHDHSTLLAGMTGSGLGGCARNWS